MLSTLKNLGITPDFLVHHFYPQDTAGNFDSSLYGWRTTGDLGIMPPGTAAKYPTCYALKAMQYLVRAGDTVLAATSDCPLLSAYAGLQTEGALTLLVINKDPTATLATELHPGEPLHLRGHRHHPCPGGEPDRETWAGRAAEPLQLTGARTAGRERGSRVSIGAADP